MFVPKKPLNREDILQNLTEARRSIKRSLRSVVILSYAGPKLVKCHCEERSDEAISDPALAT
jgi:hypothetical protein